MRRAPPRSSSTAPIHARRGLGVGGLFTVSLVLAILPAPRATQAQSLETVRGNNNGSGVANTVHNLSVFGPGKTRARDEQELCIFCHTPHGGKPGSALWNRAEPTGGLLGAGGQRPGGSSLLCLSCHDGALALGEVLSRDELIVLQGPSQLYRPAGSGTLLGDGAHPVSVPVESGKPRTGGDDSWGMLRPGLSTSSELVDSSGLVQCSSCHDPHRDDNYWPGRVPRFWRDATITETCNRCHVAQLTVAGHDQGNLPLGCASCHQSHGQPGTKLLPLPTHEFCFRCHGQDIDRQGLVEADVLSPTAAPQDILTLFRKPYTHPLSGALVSRRIDNKGEKDRFSRRGCAVCHSTHGHRDTASRVGSGQITKGSGYLDDSDTCLACHGKIGQISSGAQDLEAIFSIRAKSSHPVGRRANGSTPGASTSPGAAGVMSCGSCHGNDDPEGPAGPHGSNYRGLLRLPYFTEFGKGQDVLAEELCIDCHDRSTLSSPRIGWPLHREHVDRQGEGCASCHDPHGSLRYPGLISFGEDLFNEVVRPGISGLLEYRPGEGGGTCILSCHGVEHDQDKQRRTNFELMNQPWRGP